MNRTDIEWTFGGWTWNPTRGCSPAGVDCKNCYAMQIAGRYAEGAFKGFVRRTAKGARWTGKLALLPHKIFEPLREREGGWVFVDSMSDLFHEKLPDAAIDHVVATMLLATQHRFITLTKRPHRMADYFNDPCRTDALRAQADLIRKQFPMYAGVAIPDIQRDGLPSHTWWGMSAGNQEVFEERIGGLLAVPGLRLLSLEPLLGSIWLADVVMSKVRWVITGGESGPGRRPAELRWVRDLRDDVIRHQRPDAFFFKQWALRLCDCDHRRNQHDALGCKHCDDCRWSTMEPEPGLRSSHAVGANTQILSLPFLDEVQWATPPSIHPTGVSS